MTVQEHCPKHGSGPMRTRKGRTYCETCFWEPGMPAQAGIILERPMPVEAQLVTETDSLATGPAPAENTTEAQAPKPSLLVCSVCGRDDFTSAVARGVHERRAHGQNWSTASRAAPVPPVSAPAALPEAQTEPEREPVICWRCAQVFDSQTEIEAHECARTLPPQPQPTAVEVPTVFVTASDEPPPRAESGWDRYLGILLLQLEREFSTEGADRIERVLGIGR